MIFRLEICRDRRDRRSCKIFPSCVNFSRKQRGSLSNLHRNMKFTQLFGDFTHISFKTIEIMHIHFNFNKRDYQCSHKRCFIVAKKVVLYALLVCKIFGPKIRSCKIFDKFQVRWFLKIWDKRFTWLDVCIASTNSPSLRETTWKEILASVPGSKKILEFLVVMT